MKKMLGRIMQIDAFIGAFLMAVIFIVVILQIASRILPGNALPWTVEVGQNLLGALIWMGISIGVTEGSHVVFDVIVKKFKPRVKKTFALLANALFLADMVLIGSFTVTLLRYYMIYDSKSTILGISMFWVRLPILIGCVWTAFKLIRQEYLLVTNRVEAFPNVLEG